MKGIWGRIKALFASLKGKGGDEFERKRKKKQVKKIDDIERKMF